MNILLLAVIVSGLFFIGVGSTVYALNAIDDDIRIQSGQCIFSGDRSVSFCRTSSDGTSTTGNYMNVRGFSGVVFRTGGTGAFGTGDEIVRITNNGQFSIPNGNSLAWDDNAVSLARTNSDGDGSGNFLNLRGLSGIVFRIGGGASFGSGDEAIRITNTGQITIPSGEAIAWGDNGVSLARTNSAGSASGNFLTERGFSGIIFKTGGNGSFGTGTEQARITSAGNLGIGDSTPSERLDVAGNIRLTGNIVSPNDICIGSC